MELCVRCHQLTTERYCEEGNRASAHLMAWELDLLRRRRLSDLMALRRQLRNHTRVWERELGEAS